MLSSVFYPKINGTSAAVGDLARSLAKRDHRVFLVTRRLKGTKSSETWNGVRVQRVGPSGRILSPPVVLPQLVLVSAALAKREKIDVIHANGFLSLTAALVVSRLLSIPAVVTFHGSQRFWDPETRWRSRLDLAVTLAPEKFAISRAKRVFAQSPQLKSALQSLYGVDSRKFLAVPHPVDLETFSYHPRKEGPRIILFVGTLGKIHGPDLLMEAIPEVLREFPDARFLFVGKGPMRDRLVRLAGDLGVMDAVSLLGEVKDRSALSDRYASASLVAMPLRDSVYILPKVATEAMACGRPVLTTMELDPVLAEHGVFKIEPKPADVSRGIVGVLRLGRDDYAQACLSARRYVETACSEEKVASTIESAYYALCLETRRAGATGRL